MCAQCGSLWQNYFSRFQWGLVLEENADCFSCQWVEEKQSTQLGKQQLLRKDYRDAGGWSQTSVRAHMWDRQIYQGTDQCEGQVERFAGEGDCGQGQLFSGKAEQNGLDEQAGQKLAGGYWEQFQWADRAGIEAAIWGKNGGMGVADPDKQKTADNRGIIQLEQIRHILDNINLLQLAVKTIRILHKHRSQKIVDGKFRYIRDDTNSSRFQCYFFECQYVNGW